MIGECRVRGAYPLGGGAWTVTMEAECLLDELLGCGEVYQIRAKDEKEAIRKAENKCKRQYSKGKKIRR
jgi:hypothetical protein